MIKASKPKPNRRLRYAKAQLIKPTPDLHFLPQMFTPKTWRRGWCTFWKDGVGENGSRDFQMEGLEQREPDQQPKKLGFNAERNKVLQQRVEAWFLKNREPWGCWPIIARLPEIRMGAALNFICHSSHPHCALESGPTHSTHKTMLPLFANCSLLP